VSKSIDGKASTLDGYAGNDDNASDSTTKRSAFSGKVREIFMQSFFIIPPPHAVWPDAGDITVSVRSSVCVMCPEFTLLTRYL